LVDFFGISWKYGSLPPICASSVAVERSVFPQVGLFDESYTIGEDTDMWARIALQSPLALSPLIAAVYYRDASNRSTVRSTDIHSPIVARYLKGELNDWQAIECFEFKEFVVTQRLIAVRRMMLERRFSAAYLELIRLPRSKQYLAKIKIFVLGILILCRIYTPHY
jgi:GT2 family glycosyltransferase